MTTSRLQKEASLLRDDIELLADELVLAFEKKLTLVARIKDNAIALGSHITSENDIAAEDVTAEDSFLISNIELTDFRIASLLSKIESVTGTEREKIVSDLFKKTAQGKTIGEIQKRINQTLAEAFENKGRMVEVMEKRMKEIEKSIDDLSGMQAMRKYTPSKDPLL